MIKFPKYNQPFLFDCSEAMAQIAAREGSAAHDYPHALSFSKGRYVRRDISDAVHFILILHGSAPSLFTCAARKIVDSSLSLWLAETEEAWVFERNFLLNLVVAVGAIPSTFGQMQCESVAAEQYRALYFLADSDRCGCALGTVAALLYEWRVIRSVLEVGADYFNVTPPICLLPSLSNIADIANKYITSPAMERAFLFGAQQTARQHSELWSLLDRRCQMRSQSEAA